MLIGLPFTFFPINTYDRCTPKINWQYLETGEYSPVLVSGGIRLKIFAL